MRGGDDTRCAEVVQCHAAFGVQHNIVDIQNTSTPFVSATSHFRLATKMAHSQCTVSDRRCFRREHVSDFIRLFAVNEEGGYYLDADSFVVDARLHAAFAACPFAMFSSVGESPYYHHVNNGAFLGRPKSAFGIAWWQHFSRWDGSLWSDHSCGWPGRRASAQPGEVHVAPAMLVPPPFLTAPGSWSLRAGPPGAGDGKGRRKHKGGPQRLPSLEVVDPDVAAAAGAMLVHLTNWKVRPDNVTHGHCYSPYSTAPCASEADGAQATAPSLGGSVWPRSDVGWSRTCATFHLRLPFGMKRIGTRESRARGTQGGTEKSHDGSGKKHVAAHLPGALAPHTPHFLGPRPHLRNRTGAPFRHTPASDTACSSTAMRPPGVHSGVPAFSGTQ